MKSMQAGRQVMRVATLLAALAALLVSTIPPLGWSLLATRYQSGRMDAELRMQALTIERLIADDPAGWWQDGERLRAILAASAAGQPERYDIVDTSGILLASSDDALGGHLAGPLLTRTHVLSGSAGIVGAVRSTSSLRPLMHQTAGMALLGLLLGCGTFAVFRFVPVRSLRRSLQQVTYLASHDALTGLPNRTVFIDRLERTIATLERSRGAVAVLFLDLDQFKDVNDTLGHATGDLLLVQVCERLRGCLRRTDTLARFGGDEFAIIQAGMDQNHTAAMLAQRLIDALQDPFDVDGHEVAIGVSIGIALAGPSARFSVDLLRQADLALYRAKQDGRSTFRFFAEEMNEKLLARKAMERDLRQALAEGQLQLFYQPQIDLVHGRITGVEALLRWQHPVRGLLRPSDFLALAEETGLIMPIGAWALRRACTETRDWAPLQLGVNLSPAQFRNAGLGDMVARVLAETGFAPGRLELEITEGLLLQDTEATLATLKSIQEQGVHIVMDDFGTGYSSLSHLRKFSFHKVKIDQSFVRDLDRSGEATAIVRAVIALCHTLGMRATAEGVETSEQAKLLQAEGCQEVQGFRFGRPMPATEMRALLAARGTDGGGWGGTSSIRAA